MPFQGSLKKVWVSMKFLSAKFGLPLPPTQKLLKIGTFSGVGGGPGGKRNFMDKTILWTSGRFREVGHYLDAPCLAFSDALIF